MVATRVPPHLPRSRRSIPDETGNVLLLGLPQSSFERVLPYLQRVALSFHQTVIAAGDDVGTVYFPETGVLSEVVRLRDGSTAELNIVGREGMAGLVAYLGNRSAPLDMITLIAGTFLQMPLDTLSELAEADPALRRRLDLYTQAVLNVRAIAAACDRLHPLQTRLVRWLLRTHDRLAVDEFLLTQDDIASMLGVARQTVTASALWLQEAGLISYSHGHICLLDRPGLERLACECYWNLHSQFERLRPASSDAPHDPSATTAI
jgi:CRP-like cAMP-binding protein